MAVYSVPHLSGLAFGFRWDAEFYQPTFTEMRKRLSAATKLGELLADIRYGVQAEPDYLVSGIQYIRALNLRSPWIDGEILRIDEQQVPNADYTLQLGDILITRSGAYCGEVGIVTDKFAGAAFGSYIIRLRTNQRVNPFALFAFLLCDYGRSQTLQIRYGSAQPNLSIPYLKNLIFVPDFAGRVGKAAEELIRKAVIEAHSQEQLYKEAEAELLDRFGWHGLEHHPRELSFVKSFQELESSARFDAEHFQPQYARLQAHLHKHHSLPLNKLIQPVVNGFDCRNWQENGTPYIRVGDIGNGEISKDCARVNLNSSDILKDVQIKEADVLFARKGTYGRTGVAARVHENWIISSEIMRFRRAAGAPIVPHYLSLLLESKAGFLQVEAFVHGVSNFSISQRDVGKILIFLPRNDRGQVDLVWQEKLADKVRRASRAKAQARKDLAEAKKLIEDAIASTANGS